MEQLNSILALRDGNLYKPISKVQMPRAVVGEGEGRGRGRGTGMLKFWIDLRMTEDCRVILQCDMPYHGHPTNFFYKLANQDVRI